MFTFRLARDLGKTVAEVEQMSAAEFTEWQAFYIYEAQERERLAKRRK